MTDAVDTTTGEDGVADVVFVCPSFVDSAHEGDGIPEDVPRERFCCIRALFALRSPVFHTMLFGPFAPQSRDSEIKVCIAPCGSISMGASDSVTIDHALLSDSPTTCAVGVDECTDVFRVALIRVYGHVRL